MKNYKVKHDVMGTNVDVIPVTKVNINPQAQQSALRPISVQICQLSTCSWMLVKVFNKSIQLAEHENEITITAGCVNWQLS